MTLHRQGGTLKSAALGFRAHSGWTALVALSVSKGSPCVLARQRIHLVETFTYRFRQPYHTAKKMPLDQGRAFIVGVQTQARDLAYRAVCELQESLHAQGYRLTRSGLVLASGRPLPNLPAILASHALIHTADGELFREALLHACGRCGLLNATAKERELRDTAPQMLRLRPGDLTRSMGELGRSLGPPWSQDEKLATLVAWLALASKPSSLLRSRSSA
jgi:hypothetical protein